MWHYFLPLTGGLWNHSKDQAGRAEQPAQKSCPSLCICDRSAIKLTGRRRAGHRAGPQGSMTWEHFHWPGRLGGDRMSFGGTRTLVTNPDLPLTMNNPIWPEISPLGFSFLVHTMETGIPPHGLWWGWHELKSGRYYAACNLHRELRVRFSSPPWPRSCGQRERMGTLKENMLLFYITLKHQIAVYLTNVRGITNIFLNSGLFTI